jgi:hypothetical protein
VYSIRCKYLALLIIIITVTLFGLFLFILYMTPIYLSNDAIAISLAIFFGFVSLAVAVLFGLSDKVRDFLLETKKGQIDEKIAMLYVYTMNVYSWKSPNYNMNFVLEIILSDIRSIGRIRRSIKDEQLENMLVAKNALLAEMRAADFGNQANRIEIAFKSFAL